MISPQEVCSAKVSLINLGLENALEVGLEILYVDQKLEHQICGRSDSIEF